MNSCEYTTKQFPCGKGVRYRDDYIGQRFSKLVVIGYPMYKSGVRRAGAICRCDCGSIVRVSSIGDLVNGKTRWCRTCGRKIRSEIAKKRNEEMNAGRFCISYPGFKHERLHKVWKSMRGRCGHASGYEDVKVCDEWQDYLVFREWAYANGYDDEAPRGKCTIDRINPFGNYEPSNCRFVDMKTQSRNKRKDWLLMDDETRAAALSTAFAI